MPTTISLGYWSAAFAIGAVTMGALGAWIAPQKHRSPLEGLFLGAAFGPLGVLVECFLPTLRPRAVERRPTVAEAEGWNPPPLGEIPAEPRREVPRAIDRLEL